MVSPCKKKIRAIFGLSDSLIASTFCPCHLLAVCNVEGWFILALNGIQLMSFSVVQGRSVAYPAVGFGVSRLTNRYVLRPRTLGVQLLKHRVVCHYDVVGFVHRHDSVSALTGVDLPTW